ncbi:CopG family ribbon-helix-helix protein [Methylobacter sp. YRD-M1]|uniref:CopG family ribbon-helix-helix protein n=1 Tax=Methylobacter sp. YRD-M1 TaxID=2911520 RepID=UPI00227CF940|nr:ribbon-helix-helix protein, CopG family [Methylobacter sp. YRD-M1]
MATSVKLDDDLKNRIQHLAEMRHRSAHWIMREAIRDYVEREGKRGKLSNRRPWHPGQLIKKPDST